MHAYKTIAVPPPGANESTMMKAVFFGPDQDVVQCPRCLGQIYPSVTPPFRGACSRCGVIVGRKEENADA
jgi:hypothetical protein